MKKVFVGLAIASLILFLLPYALGVSPFALPSVFSVGAGMGAKLACSGRYITGLDAEQMLADLSSYSPLYGLVDVAYDDTQRLVSASLFGVSEHSARYRPGLGCTLEIGATEHLDVIETPTLVVRDADWPHGETVNTIQPATQAVLDELLDSDNQAGHETRGLLVVQGGKVIAEAYADGFTALTPHLGWSMGKSLTAILLGRLESIGVVDVQEKPVFPEWGGDDRRDISVEHLLQMSSGLDFEEVYAPGSDATHMLFNAPSASDVARASSLAHPPASHFSYSSGTTNLLMAYYTRKLGSEGDGGPQDAVNDLFSNLLEPLAMTNTIVEPDPSGVFVGSSYVYASTRDWARLGWLMLNDGQLNGQQIVTPEWIERATQPNPSTNDPRYGYQFWLNRGGETLRWPALPEDAYAMQGNRSQVVMMLPELDMVFVRLGWSAGGYPMATNVAAVVESLAK